MEFYKEECMRQCVGKEIQTSVQYAVKGQIGGVSLTEKGKSGDIEGLNDVYKDICEMVGFENMLKFYEQYKGFQITFPTRLYNKDYVREVVRKEFNGGNAHEIARRFGYSERWIKAIAADECKDDSKTKDEGED